MAILLTGAPGVGKTTVIVRFAEIIGNRATGFVTTEIREGRSRIGFDIVTFNGKRGVLARKGLKSRYRVGLYGVDIKSFENIALSEMQLYSNKISIIDEIGKMELHSGEFRRRLIEILNSGKPVVATIMSKSHPFTDKIKKRADCKVIEVTRGNRDEILERLVKICVGL